MTTLQKSWVAAGIVLVVLSAGGRAFASESTLINPPMKGFFSLDGQHMWALIENADKKEFLFKTTNGGESWTASPVPFPMWSVFFVDSNEGWAIAVEPLRSSVRTLCVHTSDSGQTWETLGALTKHNETPTGIAFDSKAHGWVVGEGYVGTAFVVETSDGGKNWTQLSWKTEPSSGLYGVRVQSGAAYAWSGGAGGSGIYELQRGALPKRISGGETMNFAFGSEDSLVYASQSAVYRRGGQSEKWVRVLEASTSTFRDISFVDSTHGCVAGGELYCTDDGGRTWTPRLLPRQINKPVGDYVERLHPFDRLHWWAVSGEAIFQTSDGAYTWSQMHFFDELNRPLSHLRQN